MSLHSWSLRDRTFGIMSYHDVELAETFLHRCPQVDTVMEINHFFRMTLSQLTCDTRRSRAELDDHLSHDQWLRCFQTHVLPVLLRERFPEDTRRECPAFYFSHACA